MKRIRTRAFALLLALTAVFSGLGAPAAQGLDMSTDLTCPRAAAMNDTYAGCRGGKVSRVHRVHAYPTVPSLLGSAAPRQPEDSRATACTPPK